MKYKLIDGSDFFLAGVASYTTGSKTKQDKKPRKMKINLDFDFDNPMTFGFDFDKMKEEKEKFKEDIKKQAMKFKESNKQDSTKENPKSTYNKTMESGFDFADDFLNGFGDVMNDLGKNLEQWGKSFEGSMEKFGSEIEKYVNYYAKDMEKYWTNDVPSDDYKTWELESLFNEIYNKSKKLKNYDKSPNLYYKVEAYDLGTTMNDQLLFIGCHLPCESPLPLGFVSKSFIADKWLVLKLTKEEYLDDWMQELETIELIKDYQLEQYLITRAFKNKDEQENKKIKLYIPLKNK